MKISMIIIAIFSLTLAQSTLTLDKSNSSISIMGTSTIHDWESKVNNFTVEGSKSDNTIKDLKVTIVVKSIESGKSAMDSKTFEALKESKNPKIIFEAQQVAISNNKVTGKGTLTMAGQSKNIEINGKVISDVNGKIKIEGSNKIDMTEYGMTPPTAMFGSIETGKDVVVKYNISLNY